MVRDFSTPDLFDHRREFARTDVGRGGIPTQRWRDTLDRARRLAIDAGLYQYPFPAELGGSDTRRGCYVLFRST